MSDLVVLQDIPFAASLDSLARRLHVQCDGSDHDDLVSLVHEAEQVARPKALYRLAYIDERGDDYVVADGVRLTSRILRTNVEQTERVFAQLATCGTEIDAWAESLNDVLWSFWAEAFKEVALSCAIKALAEDVQRRYAPAKSSSMAPGSLPDWPIREQRSLFALLGDVEAAIGVRLTASMLMVPNKSVSSVRFETEQDYVSCALCPRERCPGRRAPYEEGLYASRYGSGANRT